MTMPSKDRRLSVRFVCADLSWPPRDGRALRTFNTLLQASRRHDVDVATFNQYLGQDREARRDEAIATLRQTCRSVTVFRHQAHDRVLGAARSTASALAGGRLVTGEFYRDPALLRWLATPARKVDVLHIDSTDMAWARRFAPDVPAVLVHHNVESDLMQRRAMIERSPARRFIMQREARLLAQAERDAGRSFAAHFVCSAQDAVRLSAVLPPDRIHVVPNGVDVEYFRRAPLDAPRRGVLHIGGLGWVPNADGIRWFIERVWPEIRRRRPDEVLQLVGERGDFPVSSAHADAGIQFVGPVPDVRPYAAAASVFVVPLRVGGGTRLKLLDAFAMGIPVVSTRIGAEGLDADDGREILLRDTEDAFAEAVCGLLSSPERRRSLADGARALVERRYRWDVIGEVQDRGYRSAIEPR